VLAGIDVVVEGTCLQAGGSCARAIPSSTEANWRSSDDEHDDRLGSRRQGRHDGELHQFVVECEEAGAVDSTRIEADLTWGGKLKKVRVVVVRSGDGMIRPAGQEG
jgi:hypothetical protein